MGKLCLHCGEMFTDLSGRSRFCLLHNTLKKRGGRVFSKRAKAVYPIKPCCYCKKDFQPKTHRSNYCDKCRPIALAENQKRYYRKLARQGLARSYRKYYNDKAKLQSQAEAMRLAKEEREAEKELRRSNPSLFVPRVTVSTVQDLTGTKLTKTINEILSGRKAMARI